MKLTRIIQAVGAAGFTGAPDIEITGVAYDSRRVEPGFVFAAVRGLAEDGRRFVSHAVSAGAAAILTDAPLDCEPGVPVVSVTDARSAMALAAAEFYGRPTKRLVMIGITGTNGKTTTTYLLEAMLQDAGYTPGVLGTVNFRYPGCSLPAPNTTPEGPDLQGLLADMADHGASHAVMEVSSHALDLDRVSGCEFDVAVFTNLSQDHLDYHRDFETYFSAKKRLFTRFLTGSHLTGGPRAVINIDDPWGRRLADELGSVALTVAIERPADIRAQIHRADHHGIEVSFDTPHGMVDVKSRLVGKINAYNMLSAIGAGCILNLSPQLMGEALGRVGGAPGRLERVHSRPEYLALVDYAHTPDALEKAMLSVRGISAGRLITVFGCGGDRDRTKRPLMGEAAGRLSDLTIITSDNPRSEEPLAIIQDILTGIRKLALQQLDPTDLPPILPVPSYAVAPDRRSAIRLACRLLSPGDALLIAGKGHEDYQIIGREKIHFDDREEAAAALKEEGKC